MPDKVVQLSQSYENPYDGSRFNTVKLREPLYRDIYPTNLGFPFDHHPTRAGLVQELHYDKIDEYVGRLAIEPPAECLGQLVAKDAIALQKAITGFFTDTEVLITSTPATSSHLTSAGTATESSE